MASLRCALSSQVITASVLTERKVPAMVRRHQSRCLRCQAHHASLRNTRRALAGLRQEQEPAPARLQERILGLTVAAGAPLPHRHWLPAAAAVGVVVAVAAARRLSQGRSSPGGI
jgi:hypothetical protein